MQAHTHTHTHILYTWLTVAKLQLLPTQSGRQCNLWDVAAAADDDEDEDEDEVIII